MSVHIESENSLPINMYMPFFVLISLELFFLCDFES